MNTLWTFGDSAMEQNSSLVPGAPSHRSWVEILAEKLNMNLVNKSWGSSALEYSYYHYREQLPNFKPGDVVLFGVTMLNRKWLYENRPNLSHLEFVKSRKYVSDEHKDWFKMYYDDFQREDVEVHMLEAFLDSLVLNQVQKEINIVAFFTENSTELKVKIPEQLNGSISCMYEASMNEIHEGAPAFEEAFRKIGHGGKTETRKNHFSEPNHTVLADKFYDAIQTGNPIDFTQGFHNSLLGIKELL